jgi:hypothetical protein
MKSKQITLRGKELIIGHGITPYKVNGDAYIVEKLPNSKVKAYYQNEFSLNGYAKEVTATWHEVTVLPTTELKPFPEYFNEAGPVEGLEMIYLKRHPSISYGLIPGTSLHKYDYYSAMSTIAGDTMHGMIFRTCLGIFFEITYGIKCMNNQGELIQPVTFDVVFTPRQEEDPYELSITPIDGEGSFTYSIDGITYSANPAFSFETVENVKLYVKDSQGTVATRDIQVSNWNNYILP